MITEYISTLNLVQQLQLIIRNLIVSFWFSNDFYSILCNNFKIQWLIQQKIMAQTNDQRHYQNNQERIQTPQQKSQQSLLDTLCPASGCCGCCGYVKKTIKFSMALLFILTPVIALISIIFDIIYIKTHQQLLRYTDLYTIYLSFFLAIPAIAQLLALVVVVIVICDKQLKNQFFYLLSIIWFPIVFWLELLTCMFKMSSNNSQKESFGKLALPLQYLQCIVSVVQFMIQFYITGYTNTWNIFLIVKVALLLSQIVSRVIDCCKHKCCCDIQIENIQKELQNDLKCGGNK